VAVSALLALPDLPAEGRVFARVAPAVVETPGLGMSLGDRSFFALLAVLTTVTSLVSLVSAVGDAFEALVLPLSPFDTPVFVPVLTPTSSDSWASRGSVRVEQRLCAKLQRGAGDPTKVGILPGRRHRSREVGGAANQHDPA